MHPFEEALCLCTEEIEFALAAYPPLPWSDFLLNPRRLRGSDFLMRWSQGRWSEERLVLALNDTGRYFALPYGPSGVAPNKDVREYELYFERLELAGLGTVKRPDLLVFHADSKADVADLVRHLGGPQELPFTPEDDARIQQLLRKSVLAVECENSLWVAKSMPDYGRPLTSQRRLGGLPGLKKSAVIPTVIVKEEDRAFLKKWQQQANVPLHIWHTFFDLSFGLSFDDAEGLILSDKIEPTVQTFQAPGGATTRKIIYKFYYHYAYALGEMQEQPALVADRVIDKNGHILPYVRFEGGRMRIADDAMDVLDRRSDAQEGKGWTHG